MRIRVSRLAILLIVLLGYSWQVADKKITLKTVSDGQQPAQACTYSQTLITLGDTYANQNHPNKPKSFNPDNQFVISIVSNAECKETPVLILDESTTHLAPNLIDRYYKRWGSPPVFDYKRIGYFWYISKTQVKEHSTWKLAVKPPNSQGSDLKILNGPFEFPARATNYEKSVKLAIVADMDITKVSRPTLKELTNLNRTRLDAIIHDGDMAYDINSDNGMRGDYFFNNMSLIDTKIPYLPIAGNHEYRDDTRLYQYRFRMSGVDDQDPHRNKWYSMVYKGVYMIFVDLDFVYETGPETKDTFFAWFKSDLESLDTKKVRWKLYFTHRPFGCNELKYSDDCPQNMMTFRRFNALLRKYKVRQHQKRQKIQNSIFYFFLQILTLS